MKIMKWIMFYVGMFSFGWMLGDFISPSPHISGTMAAVKQCQESLPRNQHCEPVYGAKVVDNKEEN